MGINSSKSSEGSVEPVSVWSSNDKLSTEIKKIQGIRDVTTDDQLKDMKWFWINSGDEIKRYDLKTFLTKDEQELPRPRKLKLTGCTTKQLTAGRWNYFKDQAILRETNDGYGHVEHKYYTVVYENGEEPYVVNLQDILNLPTEDQKIRHKTPFNARPGVHSRYPSLKKGYELLTKANGLIEPDEKLDYKIKQFYYYDQATSGENGILSAIESIPRHNRHEYYHGFSPSRRAEIKKMRNQLAIYKKQGRYWKSRMENRLLGEKEVEKARRIYNRRIRLLKEEREKVQLTKLSNKCKDNIKHYIDMEEKYNEDESEAEQSMELIVGDIYDRKDKMRGIIHAIFDGIVVVDLHKRAQYTQYDPYNFRYYSETKFRALFERHNIIPNGTYVTNFLVNTEKGRKDWYSVIVTKVEEEKIEVDENKKDLDCFDEQVTYKVTLNPTEIKTMDRTDFLATFNSANSERPEFTPTEL